MHFSLWILNKGSQTFGSGFTKTVALESVMRLSFVERMAARSRSEPQNFSKQLMKDLVCFKRVIRGGEKNGLPDSGGWFTIEVISLGLMVSFHRLSDFSSLEIQREMEDLQDWSQAAPNRLLCEETLPG
jgi:hypothetical protein